MGSNLVFWLLNVCLRIILQALLSSVDCFQEISLKLKQSRSRSDGTFCNNLMFANDINRCQNMQIPEKMS